MPIAGAYASPSQATVKPVERLLILAVLEGFPVLPIEPAVPSLFLRAGKMGGGV